MMLFKCLFAAFLLPGFDQVNLKKNSKTDFYSIFSLKSVLITMLSRDYTTNPEYVNTTVNAGNATHLGEVNFCFSREISAFSVSFVFEGHAKYFSIKLSSQVTHIVKSDEGKTLLRRTVSSCDKKGLINIKRMLRIILGLGPNEKAEDFIPFTWICPIKKVIFSIFCSQTLLQKTMRNNFRD